MRTKESGSLIQGFSSDEQINELVDKYSKYYGITKSSFVRLGISLAAKKLENKEQLKVNKIIGAR